MGNTEGGQGFVYITVDFDNPNASPEVEVNGMSVWAAQNLCAAVADHIMCQLSDPAVVIRNRENGVDIELVGPDMDDA